MKELNAMALEHIDALLSWANQTPTTRTDELEKDLSIGLEIDIILTILNNAYQLGRCDMIDEFMNDLQEDLKNEIERI